MAEGTITIRDVARRAGVAVSTASRALGNGSASVSTRHKVRQAADELHFVPNAAAQQLTSGKSKVVAIVVPESPTFVFKDAFVSGIVSQLMSSFTKAGLLPFLALAQERAEDIEKLLDNSMAAGMVVTSFHHSKRYIKIIHEFNKPTVFVGKPPSGMHYPYVTPDSFQGGYEAGRILMQRERERIAIIEGPKDMLSPKERNQRTQGCLAAMREQGRDAMEVIPGPYAIEHGIESMRTILHDHPDVDGVFAESDQIAAGALQLLHQHHKKVPEDISVVGFDDFQIAEATSPRLTTIAQPLSELAQAATDMLVYRLERGEWKTTAETFPIKVVMRDSA